MVYDLAYVLRGNLALEINGVARIDEYYAIICAGVFKTRRRFNAEVAKRPPCFVLRFAEDGDFHGLARVPK